MKKQYIQPVLRVRSVKAADIIATSDVPIGGGDDSGTTDAPIRSSDWNNYEN